MIPDYQKIYNTYFRLAERNHFSPKPINSSTPSIANTSPKIF